MGDESTRPAGRTRHDTGRLLRHAGVAGFWNLMSRITGLIRDMVVAAFFPKAITDAFYVAYAIPNVFRRLLGEGGLTPAIQKVFSYYRTRGEDEARRFYRYTLFGMVVAGTLVTLLGMALARPLVTLFAAGFDPGRFELAVRLTRLLFPYLLLVSLMAFAMAILNSLGHYAAPAAGPVLLNISVAVGAALATLLSEWTGLSPVEILAISVLVGGLLQLLVNVPPLLRRGYGVTFRVGWHPAIWETMKRMGPSLVGIGIYQANVLISRLFASFLGKGAVSGIYYSQRLFELPMALFVASMVSSVMPKAAEAHTSGDAERFEHHLSKALHTALFLTIPATVALLVYGLPTIAVIFWRGRFDATLATYTAHALGGFVLGMVPATFSRILIAAYQGADDFRTPAIWGAGISLLGMALTAWPLMTIFGVGGLALAVSLGTTLQAVFLARRLRSSIGLALRIRWGSIAKMVAASLIMGAAIMPLTLWVSWKGAGTSPIKMAIYLGGVLLGGGIYFVAAWALRVDELRDGIALVSRWLRR